MTPEQEERLRLMRERDSRSGKQVKRPSPDANPSNDAIKDSAENGLCNLVLQYLKDSKQLVHHLQIIKELDVDPDAIDACLRKLVSAGKIRCIQGSNSTYWDALSWPKVSTSKVN